MPMTYTANRWGPWALIGTDLTIHANEINQYWANLLDCTDSAEVLDWICQIDGRYGEGPNGATITAGFVAALNDILEPQANLCSGGKAKTLSQDFIRSACARLDPPAG